MLPPPIGGLGEAYSPSNPAEGEKLIRRAGHTQFAEQSLKTALLPLPQAWRAATLKASVHSPPRLQGVPRASSSLAVFCFPSRSPPRCFYPVGALAASHTSSAKPAIEMNTKNLGKVIATPAKLGIYYWNTEKKGRREDQVHGCVCRSVAAGVRQGAGRKAHQRSDGELRNDRTGWQAAAHRQRPPRVHYHGDTAGVVKCDNVDGWHAVRAR